MLKKHILSSGIFYNFVDTDKTGMFKLSKRFVNFAQFTFGPLHDVNFKL